MIILCIFFILFIWQRYRNKDTDGNTYEEPFTTLQENAYETSANVYTNEEGGYEQLPVDHNTQSGYSVQSDDPYDSIDDRIRSGLSREEEINLEEKWYITEKKICMRISLTGQIMILYIKKQI